MRKKIEEQEMYESLAEVYDDFMNDVPYEKWCGFIVNRLKKYGIEDGLVCDLGCGSGILTTMLSDMGYDMTGIDLSAAMLGKAMERRGSRDILYLSQDVRNFELYGTMRAIISTCDTLNYVTEKKDLEKVFFLAANYLDPGGLFIFDLHTPRYYRGLGDGSYGDVTEDAAYIWDNKYSSRTGINTYELTLFIREPSGFDTGDGKHAGGQCKGLHDRGTESGTECGTECCKESGRESVTESGADRDGERYIRRFETHRERAYNMGYIKSRLNKSGLELLEIVDDYSNKKAGPRSERVVYITRKRTD